MSKEKAVKELKESAESELKSLSNKAKELSDQLQKATCNQYEQSLKFIQEKPVLSVGIALACGAFLGCLLKRK